MEVARDEFERYVREGIDDLPEWVRLKLVNLAFVVDDTVCLHTGDSMFGLYEGVPLTERGNESVSTPDKITIFMRTICDAYDSRNDIRECVKNTVWHEVAHFFGHDETWIEDEELKRGKIL